jgi:glucose/arabinose dehydrogenase
LLQKEAMTSRLAIAREKRRPARGRQLCVEALENRSVLAATYPAGFVDAPAAEGIVEGTAMEFAPNGDLWVLEQDGRVKRFRPGSTSADVVGNIANLGLNSLGERGLLGIAFHPDYASNKRVYLYYTAATPLHNRISHFTVVDADPTDYYLAGADSTVTDAGSSGTPAATVIFDLDNLSASNHNGGAIHFGPDGKLYVATGENAVTSNSQTLSNVLGKILRMNDDGSAPADNPFLDDTTDKQETIWALGLRNPYTFAFQPGTGRMFINDVGGTQWEEIDDGVAGSNYGWPQSEGNHGSPPTGPGTPRGAIYEYPHGSDTFEEGFAITGGAFYNPAVHQFPAEYAGDYFFADFVMSWINVLDVSSGQARRFATSASNPVDLRVTGDGSLYYLARGAGQVLRVNFPIDPEHPWHNAANANDVDASGAVFADDALSVINRINADGSGPLPEPGPGFSPPPFLDVTGDNYLAPDDALTVINFINANPPSVAGESVAQPDDLVELLAADIAQEQGSRRRGSRFA